MAIYIENLRESKNNESGQTQFQGEFDTRNFLIFFLTGAAQKLNEEGKKDIAERYKNAADILEKYVKRLEFRPTDIPNQFHYDLEIVPQNDETNEETHKIVYEAVINDDEVFKIIDALILEKLREAYDKANPKKKKTHKQSRSLGRNLAKIVGPDRSQLSLFNIPFEQIQAVIDKLPKGEDGIPIKDKISRNVGILSQKLLEQYQSETLDQEGYFTIHELGKLADSISTDTKELKTYFLYLGGFQFPSVTVYEERNEIGFSIAKLFYIEFIYDRKGREEGRQADINADTVSMLLNTPIKYIKVRPSEQFIRDLQGGGKRSLGYVNVNDNFIALCLGLSDYAYKIFNYSYVQKEKYTIGEEKLLEHLGLSHQAKTQGRPRIREKISEAFEDLKKHGHFTDYTIKTVPDNKSLMYEWTRSDKYIKGDPPKRIKSEIEYVDFNDNNIPVEKRKAAFEKWLIDEKGHTPGRAKRAADHKYDKAKT